MSATPEPSAAVQPDEAEKVRFPALEKNMSHWSATDESYASRSADAEGIEREGPHANGRPACTCPDEPGPEDPDWDGTLTFDPACPWHGAAPEGGGVSGAAKRDRWDSFRQMRDLHAEIIRLRADRDRLERERDDAIGIGAGMNDGPFTHCRDCGRRMVWQSANHSCPTWLCPQCVYRTKDRLERELEGARRTLRLAQQEAVSYATDPHLNVNVGLRTIARLCERALHAPESEDGNER